MTFLPPAATRDAYPRQPGIDVEHYAFRLTLSDDTDDIVGEATVQFRATAANVRELALDLTSVNAGKGMAVTDVTSPGVTVRYEHANNRERIMWPSPLAVGELRTVLVKYH